MTAVVRTFTIHAAICVVLFVLALAIRLPEAMYIPVYTDEGQDGLWALDIARGRHLPLTGSDGYYGPFFHYVLAAAFRLFATSVELPRLISVVFGALLVPVTYWLGCEVANRRAGVIAASLALTSPTLVVTHSHYAWTAAWVPLFTTATLASVYAGVTRDNARLLGLGGLLAGLGLQLHPTTMVMVIGLGAWILLDRRSRHLFRRPRLYVALALLAVGYFPVIVATLGGSDATLAEARRQTYAFGIAGDWREYLVRVGSLAKSIAAATSGALPPVTRAERLFGGCVALATLASLAFLWRRGNRLLPALFIATVGVLPLLVFGFTSRYFVFLIPAAYVAIGSAASQLYASLLPVAQPRPPARVRLREVAGVAGLLLAAFTVVWPLLNIRHYYQTAWAEARTNDAYYQLLRVLDDEGACGPSLVLEQVPVPEERFAAPNFVMNTVHYLLAMDGCVHTVVDGRSAATRSAGNGPSWTVRAQGQHGAVIDPAPGRVLITAEVPVFSTFVSVSIYQVR